MEIVTRLKWRVERDWRPSVRHWDPEVLREAREVIEGGKENVMWNESWEASREGDMFGVWWR